MTGDLEIDKADPVLILNKKLSGESAAIYGRWRRKCAGA